jgi:hypothetical protein
MQFYTHPPLKFWNFTPSQKKNGGITPSPKIDPMHMYVTLSLFTSY